MKDFYKIIGVDKNATLSDIKKRFRENALLIHPDKSGKNTKDDFIELYEAYVSWDRTRLRKGTTAETQTLVAIGPGQICVSKKRTTIF
ncbi:MAG: J domain-containing protein [Chryseotalea sp.]